VGVSLPGARYPTPQKKAEFGGGSVGALRQVLGVTVAGAISRLPLVRQQHARADDSRASAERGPQLFAHYRTGVARLLHSMGDPLMRGRILRRADAEGARRSRLSARRRRSASASIAILSASASDRQTRDHHRRSGRRRARRGRSTRRRQPTIYVPTGQTRAVDVFTLRVGNARSTRPPGQRARGRSGRSTRISDRRDPDDGRAAVEVADAAALSVTLLACFGVVAVSQDRPLRRAGIIVEPAPSPGCDGAWSPAARRHRRRWVRVCAWRLRRGGGHRARA